MAKGSGGTRSGGTGGGGFDFARDNLAKSHSIISG